MLTILKSQTSGMDLSSNHKYYYYTHQHLYDRNR